MRRKDREQKQKYIEYTDKRHRAREVEINPGDSVVIEQDKTTLQPPWDPEPFKVTKEKGTKIYMEKDSKPKIRSQDKCKLEKLPRIGILNLRLLEERK